MSYPDDCNSLPFIEQRIRIVFDSFIRDPEVKRTDIKITNMIKNAGNYRICYCQDVQEMRADYNEYVYDNSFARRKRRLS